MNTVTMNNRYPTITKEQVIECLRAARKLITRKSAWTTTFHARNKKGQAVAPTSDEAKCFCAYGAIMRAANDNFGLEACAVTSLMAALPTPHRSLVMYNDESGHGDILALFDNTIEKLEKQNDQ